jgi:hypothetical protein
MPLRRTTRPKLAATREPEPSGIRVPRPILDCYTAHRLARTPDGLVIFGVWGVTVCLGDLKDLIDECNPSKRERDASRARMSAHLARADDEDNVA